MNKGAMWGMLGVVALVAVLGGSFQSGAGRGAGAEAGKGSAQGGAHPKTTAKKGTAAANSSDSLRSSACDELAATLAGFLKVHHVLRPQSCFGDEDEDDARYGEQPVLIPGDESTAHLRFVVATLPDPLHTHLALMFDRFAEVIQAAAQDENYDYDESWLPWEETEQKYDKIDDEDTAMDRKRYREEQPGMLLFRAPSDLKNDGSLAQFRNGLIVFVVGEDPTRGIHSTQFTNALRWIRLLGGFDSTKPKLSFGILGPTFSGSLPSLEKLMALGNPNELPLGAATSPRAVPPADSGDAKTLVDA